AEDPLERWRRIQEERTKKEQQAKVEPAAATPAAAPVDPYAQQKQGLAQSMATQMQSILQSQDVKEPKTKTVTPPGWLKQLRQDQEEEAKKVAAASAATAAANAAPAAPVEILIEPGKIEYAQLIIEANSDTPGPVLAELASGPLVGDRMIGSFSKQDEFLVLKFDTVVVDGVGLSTQAIALDPETSRPGVVTDVDHKYFTRVILPAAAAFISGIGGAISTSGSTTVAAGQGTVTTAQNDLNSKQEFFKGVEKASDKFGEVLTQDASNTQVRVRVAAGTKIGVLFTRPVNKNPPGGAVMADTTLPAAQPVAQPILLQLSPQQFQAQPQPQTTQAAAPAAIKQ
ncbi:MAG: DotG, partial [Micavibrio sp.]|nr:DotG [Micavibrio sp.]